MSSERFEACIRPDPRLRRLLVCAAVAALVAGAVLLVQLPLAIPWRVALLIAWLAVGTRELRMWTTAAARIAELRIGADGQVVAGGPHAPDAPLVLLPGTVVGVRFAWLHLGFPDGDHYGELVRGHPDDGNWRRLQMHWRQTRLDGG